jgi:2-methylfumaryl-CoA isomerase
VLALADVMLATVANLGYVADVQINGSSREPIGNYLYGAYGHNFKTADGRQIMVVAISERQWRAIGKATGLTERLEMVGPLMNVDLSTEGGRFAARHAISAVLDPWFAVRTAEQIRAMFDGAGVLWGMYQDFRQLVTEDPRCSNANPMFGDVDQPGIGRIRSVSTPLSFTVNGVPPPRPAPELGADTASILRDIAGLSKDDIQQLRQRGVIC